jgi:hypothetical protein
METLIHRRHPVWSYPEAARHSVLFDLSRDRPLIEAVFGQLRERDRIIAG